MSETINKFLHESLGLCWHKWPLNDADIPTLPCAVCGDIGVMWPQPNPDYCSSLDAVAVVEKFVIEMLEDTEGEKTYAVWLSEFVDTSALSVFDAVAVATAPQRAEACSAVLKENQK